MPRHSAGLLLYRFGDEGDVEVLVVHPGGPFWARKDDGAWSIPKGEFDLGEESLSVAEREFEEELGQAPPAGTRRDLGELDQSTAKRVHAWATEGDVDAQHITSNTFEIEWPPKSGAMVSFPEVDCAAWCSIPEARVKLLPGQVGFLDRLIEFLSQ